MGESAAQGRVRTERSLNIYDSHTTPRYAGYAQSAYANSIAQQISKKESKIQNFNLVLLIAISFMREEFEIVRSTQKSDRHSLGVPMWENLLRGVKFFKIYWFVLGLSYCSALRNIRAGRVCELLAFACGKASEFVRPRVTTKQKKHLI